MRQELMAGSDKSKPIGHKLTTHDSHGLRGLSMKAVMFPFRRDDAIVQLAQDFPDLQWAMVSSTEELGREIGDAEILVTSNRACTPAYGEVLRRNARRLRWMFFSSSGIERGV